MKWKYILKKPNNQNSKSEKINIIWSVWTNNKKFSRIQIFLGQIRQTRGGEISYEATIVIQVCRSTSQAYE